MKNIVLLFVAISLLIGCGESEFEKALTKSMTEDKKSETKSENTKNMEATSAPVVNIYAVPNDYKFIKPIGYESANKLGKAIADARNKAIKDNLETLTNLVYIKDRERQWQLKEYFKMSMLINKEMLDRYAEELTEEERKAECLGVEIDDDHGMVRMNDKKNVAIIKIDNKWYIDSTQSFVSDIFVDFEGAIDYMNFHLDCLKKGMTPAEIQKKIRLDAIWSEAKVCVGTIKVYLDLYSVQIGLDLSGLKDKLAEGFVSGSSLVKELKINESIFETLKYFDRKDFSVELINEGIYGEYIIKVDASKGKGGTTGKGPKEGTGSYNSETDEWSGMLKK